MAFPDRIERSVELVHPPAKVWAALTTVEGLSAWFGEKATIDLRPGGAAQMTFRSGLTVDMQVERVEEPAVFGFTWRILDLPDDPRRNYVEFTLDAAGAGTRLRVIETGFAQLPADSRRHTYDSHAEGWESELGGLADYLDAPDPEAIAEQVFSALADPTRRAILATLAAQGPATATDLADRLPITRQAIAKHLVLLTDAGLVTPESGEGAGSVIGCTPPPCRWRSNSWAALAHDWDHRLATLKDHLDQSTPVLTITNRRSK